MAKIFFHYLNRHIKIDNKKILKQIIAKIFLAENKLFNRLDYIFCSDSYLLKINQKFLDHDYYTDVISFDLTENTAEIHGEIYISIDRVKENAKCLKSSFEEEILRVIFHGALHLCGINDKTKKEIRIMQKKENYYLQLYQKF
ncbi:MAG: rRNA maturation RNase YbeY [Chitinophagaceae bacterium]